MKKIIFPTDFSPAAANAFRYAAELAKAVDAQLDVLNVYNLPVIDATNLPAGYVEQMLEEKQVLVKEKLEAFVAEQKDAPIGELMPVYGVFIPEEIRDIVRSGDYDLVVMGTRGEHNAMEKALGSITTFTMMNAGCPVLAIPDGATWQDIDYVAFATDFLPHEQQAVAQLMDFAKKVSAEVYFVHVETKPNLGTMQDYVTLSNYPYKFTDFAIVNSPTVQEGIDNFIKEKHIDLLALYIPKRRLWERLFHSSFTKKMAFHAKTPLLVFHE
ncbi:MAG: universal stress protein [Saprospiraceae bacterium]|nr:universal stress protein [Saprospiraceae bacterium]